MNEKNIKNPIDPLQIEPIIGNSPMAKSLQRAVKRLANIDNNVFIFGETGTGKEYISRHIYLQSHRQKRNFVVVECSALGKTVNYKELFGEGLEGDQAVIRNIGLLERANKGVLYLNNVVDMSTEFQDELLRIIRDKKFRRVNGTENINLDLRIISASNRDLKQDLVSGRFKKDLFFLLNTFTLYIPPLKERKQDIPELFTYFLKKFCDQEGREEPAVPAEIFESILEYEWKGNIGELESTVHNLLMMSPPDELSSEYLPFRIKKHPLDFLEPRNLKGTISEIETYLIRKALKKFKGNQVKAAKLLGVPEATLRFKMKKHSISFK
jgi:DNA-binding NtrC family response regulator